MKPAALILTIFAMAMTAGCLTPGMEYKPYTASYPGCPAVTFHHPSGWTAEEQTLSYSSVGETPSCQIQTSVGPSGTGSFTALVRAVDVSKKFGYNEMPSPIPWDLAGDDASFVDLGMMVDAFWNTEIYNKLLDLSHGNITRDEFIAYMGSLDRLGIQFQTEAQTRHFQGDELPTYSREVTGWLEDGKCEMRVDATTKANRYWPDRVWLIEVIRMSCGGAETDWNEMDVVVRSARFAD